MEVIKLKNMNVVFAKDQPEYLQLPAYRSKEGIVNTCWKLSFVERIKLLFTGKIYVSLLTWNKPLQPLKVDTKLLSGEHYRA